MGSMNETQTYYIRDVVNIMCMIFINPLPWPHGIESLHQQHTSESRQKVVCHTITCFKFDMLLFWCTVFTYTVGKYSISFASDVS